MLPLQALAQAQPPTAPQLPMWGDGAAWQYWWVCPLMLLAMIVVFATIFFIVRRSSGDGSHAGDPRWRSASHSALQTLSERFARGEIAREEFEEKKTAILSS